MEELRGLQHREFFEVGAFGGTQVRTGADHTMLGSLSCTFVLDPLDVGDGFVGGPAMAGLPMQAFPPYISL